MSSEYEHSCQPTNGEDQVLKFPPQTVLNQDGDYPLNFKVKPDQPKSDPLKVTFDEALAAAVRSRNIAIEKLTEQQTCDLFKQAILSGDFMRHVTDDGKGQAMTYVPFRQLEALKTRILRLIEKWEGESKMMHECAKSNADRGDTNAFNQEQAQTFQMDECIKALKNGLRPPSV